MSSLEIKHFSSTKILRQTYPLSITHRNYSVFPYLTPPPPEKFIADRGVTCTSPEINGQSMPDCVFRTMTSYIFSVNQMASNAADLFLNDLTFC